MSAREARRARALKARKAASYRLLCEGKGRRGFPAHLILSAKPCNLLQGDQRHFHEFRQACRAHFSHHVGAVDFNGSRANAKCVRDGFVWLPIDQTRQHFLFPFAQGRESLLDHLCFGVRPTFAFFPRQRRANGREQSVAVERLLRRNRPLPVSSRRPPAEYRHAL